MGNKVFPFFPKPKLTLRLNPLQRKSPIIAAIDNCFVLFKGTFTLFYLNNFIFNVKMDI